MEDDMTLDDLSGYPCGDSKWPCSETCPASKHPTLCRVLPIYRAHIALRKAVLGNMTAEEAAEMYRGVAYFNPEWESNGTGAHFNALADVVEGM
jgi:hypothetical protein